MSKVQCPVVRVTAERARYPGWATVEVGALGKAFEAVTGTFKVGDLAVYVPSGQAIGLGKGVSREIIGTQGTATDRFLVPGLTTEGGLILSKMIQIAPDFSAGSLAHFAEGDDAGEFLGIATKERFTEKAVKAAVQATADWPFPTDRKTKADTPKPPANEDANKVAAMPLAQELKEIAAKADREKEELINKNWKVTVEKLADILRMAAQRQQSLVSVDVAGARVLSRLSDWAKSQGLMTSTSASSVWKGGALVCLTWNIGGILGTPATSIRITEEGRLI
jgi:hypothetical protein